MSKKQSTKSMERKPIKQRITGISKKKIVSIVVLAIMVLTAISAIVINQVNTQNLKRNESATNGDESAQALTKNETEETQNDDSNGIALYAADTTEQKSVKAIWAKVIGANHNDGINSAVVTSDGGCIVGGRFQTDSLNLGNNIVLKSKSDFNYPGTGMVIKYDDNGEVEWADAIGGNYYDSITSVAECRD